MFIIDTIYGSVFFSLGIITYAVKRVLAQLAPIINKKLAKYLIISQVLACHWKFMCPK